MQSHGIYTHTDGWEMRAHERQLSMGSSCHVRKPKKPCREARCACKVFWLISGQVGNALMRGRLACGLLLPYKEALSRGTLLDVQSLGLEAHTDMRRGMRSCAADERGLRLSYKEAMSIGTVCVQSLGMHTHADMWEMRTHARQLSMGSSCHMRMPCRGARLICNLWAY